MNIQQFETEDQWKEARKSGIGGSDCAAVLGLSPYKTALDVYCERLGLQAPTEETERMHWGKVLEAPIAEEYARVTGWKFRPLTHPLIVHDRHSWMLASPDRLIKDAPKGLEIKAVGASATSLETEDGERLWGEAGTDHIPLYYFMQCQHYLAVTGFESWDLAVLFGGQQFRIYTITPDAELHAEMMDALAQFWQRLQQHNPPEAQNDADTARAIAARFPRNNGHYLQATSECVKSLVDALRVARDRAAQAQELVTGYENQLKTIIGEHDGIEYEAGGKTHNITWKRSKDKPSIAWKELALSLQPSAEQIENFTRIIPGQRRFVVPRSWAKTTTTETKE